MWGGDGAHWSESRTRTPPASPHGHGLPTLDPDSEDETWPPTPGGHEGARPEAAAVKRLWKEGWERVREVPETACGGGETVQVAHVGPGLGQRQTCPSPSHGPILSHPLLGTAPVPECHIWPPAWGQAAPSQFRPLSEEAPEESQGCRPRPLPQREPGSPCATKQTVRAPLEHRLWGPTELLLRAWDSACLPPQGRI